MVTNQMASLAIAVDENDEHLPVVDSHLPLFRVTTATERESFCNEIANDPKYSHLLNKDSIYNLGFVFEVGSDRFREEDASGTLTHKDGNVGSQSWMSLC